MRVALLPILLVAPAGHCASIHVPTDQPTLQAALDVAAPGDTVLVAPGTYPEHSLVIPSGITLEAEGNDPDGVIVDAGGLGPVLRCEDASDVQVTGITFRGGRAPPGAQNAGGGLHCVESSPTFTRCRFVENTAEFGAGSGCLRSSPIFKECEFVSNAASATTWAAGGGLYCDSSTVTLFDCRFESNTAFSAALPGDGGGVFSGRSTVNATRCSFEGNSSGAGGGGMYSFDLDSSVLVQCTFTGNVSQAGGALYGERSFSRAEYCTFTGNEAANGGAVFMARWSFPRFTACRFEGNAARPNSGGAADLWHSLPSFEDCTFEDNSADLDGGAIMANGVSRPRLLRCVARGNTASRAGGAVRSCWATAVDVISCTFVANAAPQGGTFYHELSGPLQLNRTIVALSSAGAAASCPDTSQVFATCCDVFGNAGGDWVDALAGQEGVDGNFCADPIFCAPGAGILTLRSPESPCLPPNNPCGSLIGAQDAGCGAASSVGEGVELTSWARIKARFRR